MERISIIIPVLNEENTIIQTLSNLENASNIEIIVVDGGSKDETIAVAKSFGVQVISSGLGRATQMNMGATVATGDILLFLHADTRIPPNFDILIRQALTGNFIAGAFELKIDANLRGIRLIEKMVNLRSHLFSLPYGDQAIFIRSKVFHEIGGFPNLPIMEDFVFIRQLKKMDKIKIIPQPVLTSGRRWQKLGVIKTTLINQLIIIGYFLGVSPNQLARWYRKK
ncbi:glycosyl transferase family 2 [Crinalium epipsammum PCC 9333]|uniref:4,4'-diaponeurosporenoate glycosyltransferase n=1 Tax=Crinalium epipsammum PCC 9333 TaxID=1173022 RepID=K9VWF0_9CYAN|nr:TIGR04283 family arsenosugar biosynthesis glycosyltransferase [Crinalium epipsammum]AFZ12428.1 glycosyl transferase family 2 [Crinalium epipsammum PCC 9333]